MMLVSSEGIFMILTFGPKIFLSILTLYFKGMASFQNG